MSYSDSRPKLKAKRFAPTDPTQCVIPLGTAPDSSRAGLARSRASKRHLSESRGDNAEENKKVCLPVKNFVTNTRENATPSNNAKKSEQGVGNTSANSRLNKLKDIFKKELEEKKVNNNSRNVRNGNKIPETTRNKEKTTFSPTPKKNLANDRLNKLKMRYSSESSEDTPTNNKVVQIIDLVTPEIKENASSALLQRLAKVKNATPCSLDTSSSTLFGESPLAHRLSTIRRSKNITVRTNVPETPKNTQLEKAHPFNTRQTLTDSFQIVDEIRSPDELEISTQSEQVSTVVKSSLSQRLFKIRNEEQNPRSIIDLRPATGGRSVVRWDSSQIDTLSATQTTVTPAIDHKCTDCLRKCKTTDWINTHQCTSKENETDSSISDSMVVNVDDTVLNKTDLLDPDDCSMEVDETERAETPVNVPVPVENKPKENAVCVVADTNVFLHNLNKVKDIVSGKFSGSKKIIVYVPWMVISELDYQKDHAREPLRSIALGAIRYINTCFGEQKDGKTRKIIGQNVIDMGNQKDLGPEPDDKILSCAMQAAEKYEIVFLLSNDINLRNKAMINNIPACTPVDVIAKIKSKITINTKSASILNDLRPLCTEIICRLCRDAYGDTWRKMHMLGNPPWSFLECLKRFQKYWTAVFREKLLKQCSKTIDDLLKLMKDNNSTFCDDSDEFNQFMKLVLDFCVFLKDIREFKGSVQNTMAKILQTANGSE